jgi:hypothetical protein
MQKVDLPEVAVDGIRFKYGSNKLYMCIDRKTLGEYNIRPHAILQVSFPGACNN